MSIKLDNTQTIMITLGGVVISSIGYLLYRNNLIQKKDKHDKDNKAERKKSSSTTSEYDASYSNNSSKSSNTSKESDDDSNSKHKSLQERPFISIMKTKNPIGYSTHYDYMKEKEEKHASILENYRKKQEENNMDQGKGVAIRSKKHQKHTNYGKNKSMKKSMKK
jgi:hypothetical protein